MVSKASELLPEPDSPVITTSFSRGSSSVMFLRLCSRAPRMEMNLEVILTANVGGKGPFNKPRKGLVPKRLAGKGRASLPQPHAVRDAAKPCGRYPHAMRS